MTKTFDLYGTKLSLDAALRDVEAALGASFEPHESSYRGGDYYRFADSFVLQPNAELEDELAEPAFPGACTLLYVTQVAKPDQLCAKIVASGEF